MSEVTHQALEPGPGVIRLPVGQRYQNAGFRSLPSECAVTPGGLCARSCPASRTPSGPMARPTHTARECEQALLQHAYVAPRVTGDDWWWCARNATDARAALRSCVWPGMSRSQKLPNYRRRVKVHFQPKGWQRVRRDTVRMAVRLSWRRRTMRMPSVCHPLSSRSYVAVRSW